MRSKRLSLPLSQIKSNQSPSPSLKRPAEDSPSPRSKYPRNGDSTPPRRDPSTPKLPHSSNNPTRLRQSLTSEDLMKNRENILDEPNDTPTKPMSRRNSMTGKDQLTPSKKMIQLAAINILDKIDENCDILEKGLQKKDSSPARRSTRLLKKTIISFETAKEVLGSPLANQIITKKKIQDDLNELQLEDSTDYESSDDSDSSSEDEFQGTSLETEAALNYFKSHGLKSVKPSNHSIDKITGFSDSKNLNHAVRALTLSHPNETQKLNDRIEQRFPQWKFELEQNFNLVLFGFGSKIKLLSKFANDYLTDAPLIEFLGYNPSATIKHLLNQIINCIIKPHKTPAQPIHQLNLIKEYYQSHSHLQLYLIIHYIDSVHLKTDKNQSILCQLASLPNIKMIATVHHINAAINWTHAQLETFRFTWHDTTTFLPTIEESTFETSFTFSQSTSQKRDFNGVKHLLLSIPSNTKKIFKVLIEWQLEQQKKESEREIGLTYKEFYQMCSKKLITSTETLFRTQLTELKDHNLVCHSSERSGRGGVKLFVPLDTESLEKALEVINL